MVELLRKAIDWQALLESGEVTNQAAIARREGVTRARVTQVMCLLRLTPEIRADILALPATARRPAVTERALRLIVKVEDLTDQETKLHELLGRAT